MCFSINLQKIRTTLHTHILTQTNNLLPRTTIPIGQLCLIIHIISPTSRHGITILPITILIHGINWFIRYWVTFHKLD